MSGGYFSRGKWHALLSEMAKEAHERASRLKLKKDRESLTRAAEEAATVAATPQPDTAELARAHDELQLAVIAKTGAEVRRHAELVRVALAAHRKRLEDEDEEEAIELLLLH